MKIFLGDFHTKGGTDNTFKPATSNENLHEISNELLHLKISNCQEYKNPIP
jgi:hypothetical protein